MAKIPQGNPFSTWPTTRTGRDGAKKGMKRKQLMHIRAPRSTFLEPNLATRYPFNNVPKNVPIPADCPTRAIQEGLNR